MLEHDRYEDVCREWDDLAEQDFTYRMSEPEYFHYRQNWWISLKKSGDTGGPLRNRSDFNQALSTLNRLHREAGGQQLRPMPYWKYQQWQTVIEFFLQLAATEWILVIILRIRRKSTQEDYDRTVRPVVYRSLGKNSDEWISRVYSILLQIDRLQLTAVYCNRRGV